MIKEEKLTEIIIERLTPYFEIYPEIKGEFIHWDQRRNVYMDIGCFPKQHLIEKGFPKYFFGIEVKCFNLDTKDVSEYKKTYNLINQCISYKYSKFGKKLIEPAFILIADNFNIDSYRQDFEHKKFAEYIRNTIEIKTFAIHQNIGRLIIRNDEIIFSMHGAFWDNKRGFRHKEFLNLYCGNRDIKNKFKKALFPYEHN